MSSRDACAAAFHRAGPRKSPGVNPLSLPTHPQPSARYNADNSQRPNHEERSVNTSNGRFAYTLFDMLEAGTMTAYIRWHREGELYGVSIPNIQAFADSAMRAYFPEISKWESFQKQLNNYGFEKRNRSSSEGLYIHWDNKFRKGRPDLLPQVVCKTNRRAKASTRQYAVEKPPPPATVSDVIGTTSEPPNQPDLQARVIRLEKENSELKQMVRDLRESTERKFAELQAQLSDILGALSLGGPPGPTNHLEPAAMVFDTQFGMNEACDPIRVGDGLPPAPPTGVTYDLPPPLPTGTYNGPNVEDPYCDPYLGTETAYNTADLPSADPRWQHLHPQPSSMAPFAGPAHNPYHAGGRPTAEVPSLPDHFWCSVPENSFGGMHPQMGSGQQQRVGPAAGGQTLLPPNPPTAAPTNQIRARPGTSISAGRAHFGGLCPVPAPPSSASSSRWR